MPYSPALRRANQLTIRLRAHASTFVRSLGDPSPNVAGAADWGPVVFDDDLDELAGYLRTMDRGPLAGRLQKTGTEAKNLWLEAKGLRSRTVSENADPWNLVRIATALFTISLDDARQELEVETKSIPGLGAFLHTPTEPLKATPQGGERSKIYVQNLVIGDQNTLKDSTAAIRSTVKDSAKIVRGDHSTINANEPKGALVWFRDAFLMPLIVVLLGAFFLWWIGLTP